MTKSVLILTRYDETGASSRQRHYLFSGILQRAGYDLVYSPFLPGEYIEDLYANRRRNIGLILAAYRRRLAMLLNASRFDIVWIEKEALPWIPSAVERLLLGRVPYVIDFDDAWYLRYKESKYWFVRTAMGDKLEALAPYASALVAGNERLARWGRSCGARKVVCLPTVVDIDRYTVKPPPDIITITWIGTPVTQAFLSLIEAPLREIQKRYNARIRLIGASPHFTLNGVDVETAPWSAGTEAEDLSQCHIGIMPLPDTEWANGKCGYKLIQYMAAGRPVVATNVAGNAEVVVPRQTGFLVRSQTEWVSALSQLIENPEQARFMGLAGRQRAERLYSLDAVAPRQIQVFRDVIETEQAAAPKAL